MSHQEVEPTDHETTLTKSSFDQATAAAIARLRKERVQENARSEGIGEENGREFAIHRADRKAHRDIAELAELTGLSEPWSALWGALADRFEEENRFNAELVEQEALDCNAFAEGFIEAVAEVWSDIRDAVEQD